MFLCSEKELDHMVYDEIGCGYAIFKHLFVLFLCWW